MVLPINSSYKLVFDDEFNGQSIDTSKWNVLSTGSIGGGYSQDQFTPSNVTISGGDLDLSVTKGSTSGRPYSAGFVYTKQSWSYGYFEERAEMPASADGLWPAFWMNNAGNFPEIDIFEWLGNTPNTQWTTYHPSNDASLTGGAGLGSTSVGPNFSAGFHTYGMWWQPNSITWYIDGVQVFQLTQGEVFNGHTVDITGTAMNLILNNSVGGWNNNTVDSSTVFPANYSVDWVHVYSNNPNAVAVTPEPGYTGGGGTTNSPQPSPNGTKITSPSDASIIDANGNAWSLVQSATKGLQIAVNGTVDSITSNVVLLETLNGSIVQENSSSNWYSESLPERLLGSNPEPQSNATTARTTSCAHGHRIG